MSLAWAEEEPPDDPWDLDAQLQNAEEIVLVFMEPEEAPELPEPLELPLPSRAAGAPGPNEGAGRSEDSPPQARSPGLAETDASSPPLPLATEESPSTAALPRLPLKRKAPASGFYTSTECADTTGHFQRTLHIYANMADAEQHVGTANDDLEPVKLPGPWTMSRPCRRRIHQCAIT